MPNLFSLFVFISLEIGGNIGEITPIGSLSHNHLPSPFLGIHLTMTPPQVSSVMPEFSFAFASIAGKSLSSYTLQVLETSMLFYLRTLRLKEDRLIFSITGLGVDFFERRLLAQKEKRSYPVFYLGVGYSEKIKRVRFRINLLPSIILERGEKFNLNINNFYYLFRAELGVGYEI